jgi:hypothetical protein
MRSGSREIPDGRGMDGSLDRIRSLTGRILNPDIDHLCWPDCLNLRKLLDFMSFRFILLASKVALAHSRSTGLLCS